MPTGMRINLISACPSMDYVPEGGTTPCLRPACLGQKEKSFVLADLFFVAVVGDGHALLTA